MSDPVSLVDATYAAARWGWYLAAFMVVGASSYAPFLFPARGFHAAYPELAKALTRRAARLGLLAALALLCFSAARLYFQARTLNAPDEPLTADFVREVIGSSWGRGWKRQVALEVLALLGFATARFGRRLGWMVCMVAGFGLSLTAGMTGHANTKVAGRAGWLLDAGHVLAGAVWLGGLAVLALAGLAVCRRLPEPDRPAALRLLVADFSGRALVVAPLTVALGAALAVRYLGWSWPWHLTGSAYGLVLAGKLGALASVAALGAYNWRITQPRLLQTRGEARLRRASALELLLGVILIGVTAVLVALPLPEGSM